MTAQFVKNAPSFWVMTPLKKLLDAPLYSPHPICLPLPYVIPPLCQPPYRFSLLSRSPSLLYPPLLSFCFPFVSLPSTFPICLPSLTSFHISPLFYVSSSPMSNPPTSPPPLVLTGRSLPTPSTAHCLPFYLLSAKDMTQQYLHPPVLLSWLCFSSFFIFFFTGNPVGSHITQPPSGEGGLWARGPEVLVIPHLLACQPSPPPPLSEHSLLQILCFSRGTCKHTYLIILIYLQRGVRTVIAIKLLPSLK